MRFRGAIGILLAVQAVSVSGQAVISTHSGVVHYFEGAVFLNDQLLEPRLGRFPSMADGSELRTAKGRAEVLLTPGVILRMDQNSAVRMVSNSLADTRVELLTGSAMVESTEPEDGTRVSLKYQDWQVRFPGKGLYRIDCIPPHVWVRDGEAEVVDITNGTPVNVERGMDLPLAAALVPEQSVEDLTASPSGDGLSDWARGRTNSISADNEIAANIQDPANMSDPDPLFADLSQYGFTQFPMIGMAPITPIGPYGAGGGAYGTSMYNTLYPYQSGFYSLYLPGYTYMPLFLGLRSNPVRGPGYSTRPGYSVAPRPLPMPRTGSLVNTPRPLGPVYTPPAASRPAPISRPMPAPVRAAPVGGGRVGGAHR